MISYITERMTRFCKVSDVAQRITTGPEGGGRCVVVGAS